jgi:hypothetical protein
MFYSRVAVSALLALVVGLGGCASTPEASPAKDAEAKRFDSAPRASIIYLYRADGRTNGVSTLWIDGHLIGETLPTTYFRIAARPGRHVINAAGGDQGRIEIETREDAVYFVEMQVLGDGQGSSNTNLRMVTPETGKAAIARCCSMLEAWRPGQSRFNF